MDKKKLRDSRIELVYVYADKIEDSWGNELYKNVSINLSTNVEVGYDYLNGDIHIKKIKRGKRNFWSLDNKKNNIINNILVLGENGVGKTTLLEAIYTGTVENLCKKLGGYLFVYSIEGSDEFYVKSKGLKWNENISIEGLDVLDVEKVHTPTKDKTDFYSQYIKVVTENYGEIKGYFGIVHVNGSGVAQIDNHILLINSKEKEGMYWTMMPVECIYLKLPIGNLEEIVRFATRKHLFREIESASETSEMIEFVIEDYAMGENSIIQSRAQMQLLNTTVKSISRKQDDYLRCIKELYEVNGFDIRDLNVKEHGKENRKLIFFINVWINFFVRLFTDNLLKIEDIKEIVFKTDTYRGMFQEITLLFETLFKYESEQLYQRYRALVAAVNDLDEALFDNTTILKRKAEFIWEIDLRMLSESAKLETQFKEFLKRKDEFQNHLQKKIQDSLPWEYCKDYFINQRLKNMSSGEMMLIQNVFSKIKRYMKKVEKTDYPSYKKSVLLIMDEPDCMFHIRWSQKFTYYLIKYLNANYPKYAFQIIMSSHMPFLATDYPRENIICIPDAEWIKTHNQQEIKWLDGKSLFGSDSEIEFSGMKAFHPKYGFMSNYYDLVRDDFFVENPIGLFAQERYIKLGNEIRDISRDTSKEKLDEIEENINAIDEPILKQYLMDEFKKRASRDNDVETLLNEMQKLESRMKEVREKIAEIEEHD